uniref:Uncharacterized protein n=1 Tax=Trichogramma kaykai TaxID=54128 RepID=A0ABD2X2C6_9HYME
MYRACGCITLAHYSNSASYHHRTLCSLLGLFSNISRSHNVESDPDNVEADEESDGRDGDVVDNETNRRDDGVPDDESSGRHDGVTDDESDGRYDGEADDESDGRYDGEADDESDKRDDGEADDESDERDDGVADDDDEEEDSEFSSNSESSSETSEFPDTEGEESGDDDDTLYSIADGNSPFYQNAPITLSEHILMLLSLLMRFKLTGVLFSKILSLIALHCPQPNLCVKTIMFETC